MYALMPAKTVNLIKEVLKESANIFIGFILGKALDSLIIGIICFVLMMIFQFPYAVLISVIVGITNMIPYFGPYFGGAIGFLFVLINSPIKALFFVLLILVIQQFDGLYLGPKILGNSTGLSPLWVIFAITVGGSLFGVLGMFLGVPCVAVISYILNRIISHLLNKKHVSVPSCDSQDRM
jgi:predicted PurR-regulated permease PerM